MNEPARFHYRCSTCGATVQSPTRTPPQYPFCSARCRMADLGRWLRGQYSIERDLQAEEVDDLPVDPPAARRRAADRESQA